MANRMNDTNSKANMAQGGNQNQDRNQSQQQSKNTSQGLKNDSQVGIDRKNQDYKSNPSQSQNRSSKT